VAEEYCWAITEAAGRSCCGRSHSRMLEFGFELDSYICSWPYPYSFPTCEKFDLYRAFRNVNYFLGWGIAVFSTIRYFLQKVLYDAKSRRCREMCLSLVRPLNSVACTTRNLYVSRTKMCLTCRAHIINIYINCDCSTCDMFCRSVLEHFMWYFVPNSHRAKKLTNLHHKLKNITARNHNFKKM
jgi:hypothetical protein